VEPMSTVPVRGRGDPTYKTINIICHAGHLYYVDMAL
jgi:hypothetical protein